MKINNTYYKLGLNILALRKAFGKSQLEMANDLDIKHNTISQYENGVQVPERDILLKIAKYFKITENELIYGDFSQLEKFDVSKLNDKELNKKYFENMFPIICCEDALKNNNFRDAYKYHIQVYNAILENRDFDESNIKLFIELYKQAYKEDVVEGIANILWWTMLEGLCISINTPYFNDIIDIYSSLSLEKLFEILFLNTEDKEYAERNKEYEKERLKYIVDTEKDFLQNISILKHTTKYSELADYYISLRYILGLYNNTLSIELNRTIGFEIYNTFEQLGNKYIKNIKLIYSNKK